MANRKQTPDVLGEILGGALPAPAEPAPVPKPKAAPKRSRSPRRPSAGKEPKRPRWEYLEVVFRDYGGYRPRYVNGQEQPGWKGAPLIRDYLAQLGEEGWELAGLGTRVDREMPAYFKRPKA